MIRKLQLGFLTDEPTQRKSVGSSAKMYSVRNSDWTLEFSAYIFETIFSSIIAQSVIDWKVLH